MKSYAQNFEDVILFRAFRDVRRGFYIDIGAHDPVYDSVSLAFYEIGWRGVHVEPHRLFAEKLRKARPDETVLELAIGTRNGETTFYEVGTTGLSSVDEDLARRGAERGYSLATSTVRLLRTSDLLDRFSDRPIHWLKIDVEGFEAKVIAGWLPSKVRPWVVVVESTVPGAPVPNYAEWDPTLCELGYEFVYFDGLNRFYLSHAHPELKKHFGLPPNVFDEFQKVDFAAEAQIAELRQQNKRLKKRGAFLRNLVWRRGGARLFQKSQPLFRQLLTALASRILLRADGKLHRWARRLLQHKNGKIRSRATRIVFTSAGSVRPVFSRAGLERQADEHNGEVLGWDRHASAVALQEALNSAPAEGGR